MKGFSLLNYLEEAKTHLNFVFGGVRMYFVNKADPLGLNLLLVVDVLGPQNGCRKTSLPK